MDKQQIALKLAMDTLGVEINEDNYRTVCDTTYLAIRKACLPFNYRFVICCGHAYAAKSWGIHFEGLPTDFEQILHDLREGFDESEGWKLDEVSIAKLIQLKQEIKNKGLEVLLANAA